MFQSFEASTNPSTAAARVAKLQDAMKAAGADAFLVPRADAHQGEYVAACDERLAWISSFTGSAGYAAILRDSAGIFVDGRYTLQVRSQVDMDVFTPLNHPNDKLGIWLANNLNDGAIVAYDPWLYTVSQINALQKDAPELVFQTGENLIDEIWTDRPDEPADLMVPHPLEFSGKPHLEKMETLAHDLRAKGASAAALTLTDAVAWLLNTRGSDLGQTPVARAFAILHADATVELFLSTSKADDQLRDHLGDTVSIHEPGTFIDRLKGVKGAVSLDKSSAPIKLSQELTEAGVEIIYAEDPTILPKARKNQTELSGAQSAHVRDGAAMVEFLSWLAAQGDKPDLTEIDVVTALEEKRRATNQLQNISFDTICGAGPNGAIVHYRVTKETNRAIETGDVLLVDSGGQYLDGTTDITRTMAIGEVSAEAKRAFTLVLKGMIAVSKIRFPKGLSGRDIDPLARAALWNAGLDYDHGTGHGVGSYLSVHEGPQRISKVSETPLEPGMILSNEPGYYREGEFGIRIENLIFVSQAKPLEGADDREMYEFTTLTCAPIDTNMIQSELLENAERDWLNTYHEWVANTLCDLVSEEAKLWLARACSPI